jgi:hypothetical protein
MKRAKRAVGAVALALVGVAIVAGCGQSVATCATVCALPDAPGACLGTCNADQMASDSAGRTADFQAYLTCLGNAGTYMAAVGDCESDARVVGIDARAMLLGSGTVDGGDGDASGNAGSCAAATCESVCANDTSVATCVSACSGAEATCAGASQEFATVLTCLCEAGGWIQGTSTNTPCAAAILALDQNCPAFPAH